MKETKDKRNTRKKGGTQPGTRRAHFRIGGMLLAVFLAMYIPSFFHWASGRNIKTDIMRMGSLEEAVSVEGIIIRDEETLISGFSGRLVPDIADGERAPANSRVATVLKSESLVLLDRLREKELKIIEEQQNQSDNASLFSEDVLKIEEMIGQKVGQLVIQANKNSLSQIRSLGNDINSLIEKRATVLGGLGTANAYINSLKTERDAIKNQLDSNTESVTTTEPGIISYSVDGYEEVINPKAIEELTPGVISGIKNVRSSGSALNTDIEVDKPFAKVIKGTEIYIAAVLEERQAAGFKAGDSISLRINDIGKQINNVKVQYVSEKIDGKYIIAVKIDRYLNETSGMRRISIDLIKNYGEGLKVSTASLFNMNQNRSEADIFLVKYNCADARRVRVLLSNSEYALITSLEDKSKEGVSLYDIYVVTPKNIEEGQIIEK